MIWFMLILGIVVGTAGYWAYDKFFGEVEASVKSEAQKFAKKL